MRKILMIGSLTIVSVMAIMFLLSFSLVNPISGKIYYFSTSGSDSNDGLSPDAPKQTLAAASELIEPGNTILFKRGDKWYNPSYEWNFTNKTGTSQAPVLIDAYGAGHKPVIACMELLNTGWTDEGLNRWSHILNSYNDVSRCFIDGVSCVRMNGPEDIIAPAQFAVADSKLFIYSAITPVFVEAINKNTNFNIMDVTNCSYLTFRNIEFRGGSHWFAIYIEQQSSHITIDSCNVVENFMYGIMFDNPTKNYGLFHESPVVKNCYLNMGWNAQECKATSTYGGDGINFRSAVLNGLVQGNTVVNYQHTGIALELTGTDYIGVNNNIIECNEVYLAAPGYCHAFDCQGTEGKCTGNIFRRNYFHDVPCTSHLLGNGNYVYSNIFKNMYSTPCGKLLQAHAVDLMPFGKFICKNNYFINNTIYNTDMSGIMINGTSYVYQNIIKNNIILKWSPVASAYGLRNDGSYETQIVENNCIYNFGQNNGKVIREGSVSHIFNAKEANKALNNYKKNIDIDPKLVDPANGDFHLRPDSPCNSAGQKISDMGQGFVDYYGKPWNRKHPSIGAIQY